MEVTLPAVRNSIPMLSTVPLPLDFRHLLSVQTTLRSPSDALIQPCSTFNLSVGTSLLGHSTTSAEAVPKANALYSHLDRSSCMWLFTAWFPLHVLLDSCGAEKTVSGDNTTVSMQSFATYVRFGIDGMVSVEDRLVPASASIMATSPSSLSGSLPPPVHILSQTGMSLPYLYPVSFSPVGRESLQILFYVVSEPGQALVPVGGQQQNLQLLHLHQTRKVWRLQQDLQFRHAVVILTESCTQCERKEYVFRMPLEWDEDEGRIGLQLNASVALHHNSIAIGVQTQSLS